MKKLLKFSFWLTAYLFFSFYVFDYFLEFSNTKPFIMFIWSWLSIFSGVSVLKYMEKRWKKI